MSMIPWGDFVALADPPAAEQEKRTRAGLYLPETRDVDVINRGVVVGVGPAVDAPDGFEPGALIIYGHDCGFKVGDLKFIRCSCIIGWEPAP